MSGDEILYRFVESEYYDRPAHVFGLDHYDRDSRGEDEFTRKLIWFYVHDNGGIEHEFEDRTRQLFGQLFDRDEEDWDIVTLCPTHKKGGVNVHLQELLQDVADRTGVEYSQVLFRNRNIEENHEIESLRKKVLNLEGSVDVVEDVSGKNVIVADNVSLSGASMLHATQELYSAGAENVVCVCLGLGLGESGNDVVVEEGMTASETMEKHGEPVVKP